MEEVIIISYRLQFILQGRLGEAINNFQIAYLLE
jgi:hypothetical protein